MPVETTYIAAFLAGLLGGVHCLGMCGGIVSALSLGIKPNANQFKLYPFIFAYNLGRLISYSFAGMLVGGISMIAANLPMLHYIQSGLQFIAALFMIALGLYIAGWWFGLRKIERAGTILWKKIEPLSRRFIPVQSITQAFLLGTLWGWLPCGLVYTILFWTITTGSAVQGGLLMLSFGLGTLPMLLAMGIFAANLNQFIQKNWIRAIAGSIIIGFGLFSLINLSIELRF